MSAVVLRPMTPADRGAVADLICRSTNAWYESHARPRVFDSPETAAVIVDVYDSLDPGCGLLALDPRSHGIVGSCFYHPRETHVSLGIMNVHPQHAGRGVARALLSRITHTADELRKPTRLVSSAMNLDSFSLYTRGGFVPRQAYQDMVVTVPPEGLHAKIDSQHTLRPARPADVPALVKLEHDVLGIRREKDFAMWTANAMGIWSIDVAESAAGELDGYMVSCSHPGSPMAGPCAARTSPIAAALLVKRLNAHRGRTMVFLVPVDAAELVSFAYALGARNCEIHFAQCRGKWHAIKGVFMPTFLPESA